MDRRDFLGGTLATATLLAGGRAGAQRPPTVEALWDAFRARFIQGDGRVIDHGAEGRSTSEGQAYALFHALVLRDFATFRRLLEWTANNLCRGDLGSRLPAWSWGRRDDGRWEVLDENNATDADLLIAYCLAEAPRVFGSRWVPHPALPLLLRRLADACLRRTAAWGPVLLPAAQGFEQGRQLRLNPSYLMRPLYAGLARFAPQGPWAALDVAAGRLLAAAAAPRGIARDWITIDRDDAGGRVGGDPQGSYDAIRVYLWCGLAGDHRTARAYQGFLAQIADGRVPERVDASTGHGSPAGPPLLSAALLPWLWLIGADATLRRHRDRVLATLAADHDLRRTGYYDANLALFAEGWRQGRYRFAAGGRLVLDNEE